MEVVGPLSDDHWSLPDLSELTHFDDKLREVAIDRKTVEVAAQKAESALATCRAERDRPGVIWLLGYIGNAYRVLGKTEQSIAALRECLNVATTSGDNRGASVARIRLGESLRCNDQLSVAEAVLNEALRNLESPDQADTRGFALQHLGKCLVDQGRFDEGEECLGEALQIRLAKGDAALIASTEAALRFSAHRR